MQHFIPKYHCCKRLFNKNIKEKYLYKKTHSRNFSNLFVTSKICLENQSERQKIEGMDLN